MVGFWNLGFWDLRPRAAGSGFFCKTLNSIYNASDAIGAIDATDMNISLINIFSVFFEILSHAKAPRREDLAFLAALRENN
jgi:hypothetical protein